MVTLLTLGSGISRFVPPVLTVPLLQGDRSKDRGNAQKMAEADFVYYHFVISYMDFHVHYLLEVL